MKNRQYSVKVFETTVENEMKFIEFLDTNYVLFKDHLILVNGDMSKEIEDYLTNKPFYFLHNRTLPLGRSRKSLEEEIKLGEPKSDLKEFIELQNKLIEQVNENALNEHIHQVEIQKAKNEIEILSKKLKRNFKVMDTIIRSGRQLNIEGDLLLLNRVNSGAMVCTTGNLIVTQVVEGALRCDGNFMMITVSPKANIIFNGVVVDNTLLENKLNRIELRNREIFITPVIKKEINWA